MAYPDSVLIEMPVHIPGASVHDTLFLDRWEHTFSTDTLILLDTVITTDKAARVRLKRWYDSKLQAFRIECEALSKDTVFNERVKTVMVVKQAESSGGGMAWLWWILAALGLLLILILRR